MDREREREREFSDGEDDDRSREPPTRYYFCHMNLTFALFLITSQQNKSHPVIS